LLRLVTSAVWLYFANAWPGVLFTICCHAPSVGALVEIVPAYAKFPGVRSFARRPLTVTSPTKPGLAHCQFAASRPAAEKNRSRVRPGILTPPCDPVGHGPVTIQFFTASGLSPGCESPVARVSGTPPTVTVVDA